MLKEFNTKQLEYPFNPILHYKLAIKEMKTRQKIQKWLLRPTTEI